MPSDAAISDVENTVRPDPAGELVTLHGITPDTYVNVERKFGFKKTTKTDELGNEVTQDARPPVVLHIPVPTMNAVLEEIQNPNVQKMILEIIQDAVIQQARSQINDFVTNNPAKAMTQDDLDISQLTLTALANMPPAARRGGGIAKELWEGFEKDYIEVMVSKFGKQKAMAERAADLFVKKLQPVKTNKPVLSKLRELLAQWFSESQAQDEYAVCYAFLDKKIEDFLNVDEAELAAQL